MPGFHVVATIPASYVQSLVWHGEVLVDWVGGGQQYQLDGTKISRAMGYAYGFDAACLSVSGLYSVIYKRLGTKGVLLKAGEVAREINRSYYHADTYEYPVCFAQRKNGQEVLIHCPDGYDRLEIEDVATGERLTCSEGRKPRDFFYSRLSVDPTSSFLLSAGWVWHPHSTVALFDLEKAISDPKTLDDSVLVPCFPVEIETASFLGKNRLILSTTDETFEDDVYTPDEIEPRHVCVWDVEANSLIKKARVQKPLGTMMPVGEDYVVGFYQHPSLVSMASGEVIAEMPELATGIQRSSIIHHIDPVPPLAIDAQRKRFAVANDREIVVVEVAE